MREGGEFGSRDPRRRPTASAECQGVAWHCQASIQHNTGGLNHPMAVRGAGGGHVSIYQNTEQIGTINKNNCYVSLTRMTWLFKPIRNAIRDSQSPCRDFEHFLFLNLH